MKETLRYVSERPPAAGPASGKAMQCKCRARDANRCLLNSLKRPERDLN